jgi:6-phosphofructokinase 1
MLGAFGMKRIGILTGGGDVPPLNAVIASAQEEAARKSIEIIGFIKGWWGILEKRCISLSSLSIDPTIGGTILKSSRLNLRKVQDGPAIVLQNLEQLGVQGLIVIGGEDTLSNSFCLPRLPQVLISKTIDNDVGILPRVGEKISPGNIINYFTLGFPTAAAKISSFVSLKEGLRTTAYSHERILFVESMGMHAGWFALSSAMGHPDFIIIPEFPVQLEKLMVAITKRYEKSRNVIVVVAEGARWEDGSYIGANEKDGDDFGHPRFKGSAESLANTLRDHLKEQLDTRNLNAVNPSYLYRSGPPVELDRVWSIELGRKAVQMFSEGHAEPVFLSVGIDDSRFECQPIPLNPHQNISPFYRLVDERFFDSQNFSITEAGREYLSAIVRDIPLTISYGLETLPS